MTTDWSPWLISEICKEYRRKRMNDAIELRRAFEIDLSKLIMSSLAAGLHQDELINALGTKLDEEMRLRESRRRAARSY